MSIEGMSKAESRATLDFLFAHCENPGYRFTVKGDRPFRRR